MQTPSVSACQSTRLCLFCKSPIVGRNRHAAYCSKSCADKYRPYKRQGVCKTCGKHSLKLSRKGYCSRECSGSRPRAKDPCIELLVEHAKQGMNCKRSARILGKSGNFVYKNRRKLGLAVPSRKEWNRALAVEKGNARPDQWGLKNPSSLEEWQAWAYREDQKEWTEFASIACWSNDTNVQREMARLAYYRDHETNKARSREIAKRRYHKLKHTPNFKVKHMMRNTLQRIARKVSFRKTERTNVYLGCTIDEARRHIEKQFQRGMAWDNHGVWELDHIIPLAKWDLTNPQHIKRANHFTNLQPLWKRDNREKGARLIGSHQMALL